VFDGGKLFLGQIRLGLILVLLLVSKMLLER
jgi:hypothetical protein